MQYEEIPPIPRKRIQEFLVGSDEAAIVIGVLSAALHDPELAWATSICVSHLNHPAIAVKAAAITGLGHIARIHRTIDVAIVLPKLLTLQADPILGGIVDDVIDDFRLFAADDYENRQMIEP